jgi:hypothetical protein
MDEFLTLGADPYDADESRDGRIFRDVAAL